MATELTAAKRMTAELSLAKRHAQQLLELDSEARARVRRLIEELLADGEPAKSTGQKQ